MNRLGSTAFRAMIVAPGAENDRDGALDAATVTRHYEHDESPVDVMRLVATRCRVFSNQGHHSRHELRCHF